MPLPVLSSLQAVSASDLVRYTANAAIAWSQHLTDEIATPQARLFIQPTLPDIADANCTHGALAPSPQAAADLIAQVHQRFAQAGAKCQRWTLAPATPGAPPSADPQSFGSLLANRGYRPAPQAVLHLRHQPPTPPPPALSTIKVIPARAAYRQLRDLLAHQAADQSAPSVPQSALLHLDDGHVDALLALDGPTAVGWIATLTVGQSGAIQALFVHPAHRRRRLATLLLSHALQACARAQLRHVLLALDATDALAQTFFQHAGFHPIGTLETFAAA